VNLTYRDLTDRQQFTENIVLLLGFNLIADLARGKLSQILKDSNWPRSRIQLPGQARSDKFVANHLFVTPYLMIIFC